VGSPTDNLGCHRDQEWEHGPARHIARLMLCASFLSLGADRVGAGAVAPAPQPPCGVAIVGERDLRYGEHPLDEARPFAPIKFHRNEAPGPDSMLLVSRTTNGFFPRVYLENLRSGAKECLEPQGWSELPAWAPDGSRFAYVNQDTVTNTERLVVMARATRSRAAFEGLAHVVDFWWSPDSRMVALYGQDLATRAPALYIFWPLLQKSWHVDNLNLFLDYDASWSPDSRLLAFSRPTNVSPTEEILESDLHFADVRRHLVCTPRITRSLVELDPRWVGPRAVRCLVASVKAGRTGALREVVLEVSTSTEPHSHRDKRGSTR